MVLEILLVEDSEPDVHLVRLALQAWKTPFNLRVFGNAEEALKFLHRKNEFSECSLPHLALIDLNLPGQSGLVVLEAISAIPELRNAFVFVLSTSTAPSDVTKALPYATAYFQKPMDAVAIFRLFEALETVLRMDVRFAMMPQVR
jgi:CheY-like chemotaxis protein